MIHDPASGDLWYYRHRVIERIEDFPDCDTLFGFCYKITNLKTGVFYIGKKQFHSCRRKKIGVREKKTTRKRFKEVVKESDWKNYWGSNEELKEEVARLGASYFKREILELARSAKYLSYIEVKYQFLHDVLTVPSYNKNILGKFFPKDLT